MRNREKLTDLYSKLRLYMGNGVMSWGTMLYLHHLSEIEHAVFSGDLKMGPSGEIYITSYALWLGRKLAETKHTQ